MAKPAIIGPQIYQKVTEMIADGTVKNKTEAFKRISEDPEHMGIEMTGQSVGTVAASYFRVARQMAERDTAQARQAQVVAQEAMTQVPEAEVVPGLPAKEADALANRFLDNAERLAQMLREQAEENRELRAKLNTISSALR